MEFGANNKGPFGIVPSFECSNVIVENDSLFLNIIIGVKGY